MRTLIDELEAAVTPGAAQALGLHGGQGFGEAAVQARLVLQRVANILAHQQAAERRVRQRFLRTRNVPVEVPGLPMVSWRWLLPW